MTNVKRIGLPLKKIGSILIGILLLTVGYFSCEAYHVLGDKEEVVIEKNPIRDVQGMKEVSVAIDSKGNLLVFNRENGSYTCYSDSVGISIFNLYSKMIYSSIKSDQ